MNGRTVVEMGVFYRLQSAMADPSFYDKPFSETEPLLKEVAEVQAELDTATERWIELEEMTG